jgi:hypothetical protein
LCLAVVKPQLALGMAAPLLRSRPKAVAWFALGASVLAVLSLALIGLDGACDLVNLTALSATDANPFVKPGQMFNLSGFLIRARVSHVPLVAWGVFALWLLASPFVARNNFPLAVVASLFLSPYLHGYDLALLVVPVVALMVMTNPRTGLLVPASLSALSIAGYLLKVRYEVSLAVMLALAFALLLQRRAARKLDPDAPNYNPNLPPIFEPNYAEKGGR